MPGWSRLHNEVMTCVGIVAKPFFQRSVITVMQSRGHGYVLKIGFAQPEQ